MFSESVERDHRQKIGKKDLASTLGINFLFIHIIT